MPSLYLARLSLTFSVHSIGILGLCQQGTISEGTWSDPESSGSWGSAWEAGLRGHRDPGAQKDTLLPQRAPAGARLLENKPFAKGVGGM